MSWDDVYIMPIGPFGCWGLVKKYVIGFPLEKSVVIETSFRSY